VPDLVADLLPLDITSVLDRLEEADPKRLRYGWLLRMSDCYLGANTASSFCERMISVGNDVMPDGRAVLGDDLVEMVTVLRMNRAFMKMMKEKHGYLVNRLIEDGLASVVGLINEQATAGAGVGGQ
jgi:hypothetical protein